MEESMLLIPILLLKGRREKNRRGLKQISKMVSLARLIALIGLWALLCNVVNGVPNTNLTQVLCNGDMFTGGDPFAGNLVYVLDDLEAFAPPAEDRDYYNISPFPIAFAYGHARCVATLSNSDCKTCLKSARETMLATCVSSIGARAVLYDCNIRYEQYPFTD